MSDKKICLTHNHADEQLEIAALAGADLEPSALQGDDFCADADAVREAALLLYGKTREWLNVLVGDQNGRKKSKGVACHCFGDKMLSGSVLHYEDNTYIASADFNLLLQARDVHFVQLCQLLGRYWGTFSTFADDNGMLLERAPLTCEEGLAKYLSGMAGTRGVGTLRKAMRYTCANAASPQEVNLQLALCLPTTCNGFALKKPVANYVVKFDQEDQKLYDVDEIRVDLYWPEASFGLEYLGKKEHQGRMCADVSRWYAARNKGIELWFVTKEQLKKAEAVDLIAREVARRTRKRINEWTWPTIEELQELLDILRGARTTDPGRQLRARAIRM
ncbi:MAG: hypothetical protein IJ781_11325 [Atopobiaceae bacterium]|nr:hypothetical protein [Atopobiaceae bacterium]